MKSMKKLNLEIKVTTVQHGFALEIGNKGWLCEDELELARNPCQKRECVCCFVLWHLGKLKN